MKKKTPVIVAFALLLGLSAFVLTGCGSATDQSLEDYMKDQVAERGSVDARLAIFSPDAKATVQYSDNNAIVTVSYYAMGDDEIAAVEPEKAEARTNAILKPVLEQFAADTGNQAKVTVEVQGHVTE